MSWLPSLLLLTLGYSLPLVSSTVVHRNDLKKLLTRSEWKSFVGSGNESGVDVVWLGKGPVAAGSELSLTAGGQRLGLRVWPVRWALVDDHFVGLIRYRNGSRQLPRTLIRPECYFRSPPPYPAALTLCDGTRGIIASGNDYFVINPLPKRFHGSGERVPHVIVKRSLVELGPALGSTPVDKSATEKPTVSGRSLTESWDSPVHVETAVFVDKDLYRHMSDNFPVDTEKEVVRFVLTMVNAVQLLYEDPSLGRAVNFVVKRLEMLEGDPEGLVRSHDIDTFLANFCAWQSRHNPPADSHPLHWDHALMLTGLDLYVISKNGKVSRQVVGLAPVAGMCTPTSSCTVNEGRHFESVYVVAHEIGHNLGMRHDGPLADNNCDPGSFLMSPTLGSGKITWSSCSKHYLDQFLSTPQSHCLMDHSNSEIHLNHKAEGTLPGERFDANQQCMLKYGRGSVHASTQPLNDICRDLHCTRDRYTWTSHPALEGTYCGLSKWCRSGRCIDKGLNVLQAVQQAVTGGWSKWTAYSDCASSCLYGDKGTLPSGSAGIMVASRLCNNPRPENGGNTCVGSDKRYKTCTPSQCENIPRTTIQNYADEVCLRAREVDNELTGAGFQKPNSKPEEACIVWCRKRGGGLKSKGWTFPDGTTCQTHRRHRPMYCITGVCQEFKCLRNNEEDIFLISPGMCASTLLFSRDKRREVAVGVWLPVSDCYYNCIIPGRGVRLVEKRECRYCNVTTSIQLCPPKMKNCDSVKTAVEQASSVCSKYRDKVQRLSGFGMQLSASQEDPDRPCRLACQDETMPQRFYLVNGEDGWFPFGTDCSRGDTTKKAYCVSGKCLEFGSDDSPLHDSSYIFMEVHSRHHRSAEVSPMKNKSIDFSIDIQNPVDVLEKDLCFINGLDRV